MRRKVQTLQHPRGGFTRKTRKKNVINLGQRNPAAIHEFHATDRIEQLMAKIRRGTCTAQIQRDSLQQPRSTMDREAIDKGSTAISAERKVSKKRIVWSDTPPMDGDYARIRYASDPLLLPGEGRPVPEQSAAV